MPRPPEHAPRAPLLGGVSAAERATLLARCATRNYAKGASIVREMAKDNNVYFINRGKVQVTLLSRDGKEISFANLGAGENFGEISAIDGGPRSANVVALADTNITIMPPHVFRHMLTQHPEAALALLQQLAAIIRRLCERIFEYSTAGVNRRIHAELLRLARGNLDLDGIARIRTPPTHAQMAGRISCHREAVSRELMALEHEGLLRRERGKWVIPDMPGLQRLVEGIGAGRS